MGESGIEIENDEIDQCYDDYDVNARMTMTMLMMMLLRFVFHCVA